MYFVSSARFIIVSSMLDGSGTETHWNNWVPIKLNILIWKINLGIIPTRVRLSHWGLELHLILRPVCHIAIEIIDHLFVGCSELTDIWRHVTIWSDVHLPDHFTIIDFMLWSDSTSLRGSQRKVFDVVVISTFWCLWNFRNIIVLERLFLEKSLIFDDFVEKTFLNFH